MRGNLDQHILILHTHVDVIDDEHTLDHLAFAATLGIKCLGVPLIDPSALDEIRG